LEIPENKECGKCFIEAILKVKNEGKNHITIKKCKECEFYKKMIEGK